MSGAASFPIAETADNDDAVARESSGVEVGWWESILRIAVNFDLIVRAEDDDIVVDAEVRVVIVFMLATNANHAPVGSFGAGGAHSVEIPDRPILAVRWHFEEIANAIWAMAGLELAISGHYTEPGKSAPFVRRGSAIATDHPLPKGQPHPLWVPLAETGAPLFFEQFAVNFHHSRL